MRTSFTGQVAIVTGAAQGMGKEHALLLGRLGAAVVVNDVSEAAQAVVDEIVGGGGSAVLSLQDISRPEGGGALVAAAIENFGGLHMIVSNAGIINSTPFGDITYDSFDRVMKVNAYGAFNLLNAAWPHLLDQQYGRVVIVTSASAFVSQPLISHYAASKGAVLGLSKSLAAEGTGNGITVNALAPGAFTAMSGELNDEEARRRTQTMLPASLIAPVVAWLLRRENLINGQLIEAAGGRAAINFVGSGKGFWKKDLTIEDLVAHEAEVLDTEGFRVLSDTVALTNWMMDNTGWAAELGD